MVLQLARAHKSPLCAVARPAGTEFLRFAWSQADADTRSLCEQLEAGNLCGEPSLKASDLTLGASALVAAALRFFKLKEGDAHAFITRGDSVKPPALRNRMNHCRGKLEPARRCFCNFTCESAAALIQAPLFAPVGYTYPKLVRWSRSGQALPSGESRRLALSPVWLLVAPTAHACLARLWPCASAQALRLFLRTTSQASNRASSRTTRWTGFPQTHL